jgi:hypothetical protein
MSINASTETAIFERIVLPHEPDLSEAAARSILAMNFSAEDQARMQELADKAQSGRLTPEEREATENYEHVGHYLAILQSKARLALKSITDSHS